jgi:hypothetical protein
MSDSNSDINKLRPSESLANMAKDALDELGDFPHLKKQLDDALNPDPTLKNISDAFKIDDGLV